MKLTIIASTVLALCAASAASAQTTQAAGKVLIVAGTASIDRAGQQLPLIAGSAVESGDTLFVGDKSTLQVRFSDESVVALRANSQFKIENYKFDKNAETDRSVLGLIKGGMRTITGLIGKANNKNYLVQTATATIGIRGTHFAVVSCNNDCSRADGTAEVNGTYGSVTDGRISVSNTSGAVEFGQQDSFFVSTPNTSPVRLLVPPAILADKGASSRGKAPAGAGGQGDSSANSTSRSSGTGESTSPQLVVQSSPGIALNAALTSASPLSAPALTSSLTTSVGNKLPEALPLPAALPLPPAAPLSYASIATIRLSGLMTPNGTGSISQTNNLFSIFTAVLNEPELANAVVVDSASAAAAISRFRPVSSSAAAAVYWYYVAPSATYDLGTHRAFGDAPLGTAPTSGIAQYNYVGSTTPTDNYGRAGTFNGSNLAVNFSNQTIQTQSSTSIVFASNALMPITTTYSMPPQTLRMLSNSDSVSVICVSCTGLTSANVSGQFLGANRQGYAASLRVFTTSLTTGNTTNAGGNVSVYARQ